MTRRTIRTLAITFSLLAGLSASTYADVSNAAMLFLRIAPGARAAGLGEAYVAIADDATASHWNPAGLGAFPLAADWLDSKIPDEMRPITAIAAVKEGRASNYLGFDVWALTAHGLRRYDNRNWNSSELFNVPSSQSLEQFVARYFSVTDDETRVAIAKRVAEFNNRQSFEQLTALKDSMLAVVPENYSARQSLVDGFDSLSAAYYQCRIDWGYLSVVRDDFRKGYADSTLSERELDRLRVAVERALLRYIQEEITIPFSALFDEAPTLLESNGEVLLVGSPSGLYQYRGAAWRRLTIEDGLPSENIVGLKRINSHVLIATDKGIVIHNGLVIATISGMETLPSGTIQAMGASSLSNIYAVVDNDLYHFDGSVWANWRDYTVVLDDNHDAITNKLVVYGTDRERDIYRTKLSGIDQYREMPAEKTAKVAVPAVPVQGEAIVIDSLEKAVNLEVSDSAVTTIDTTAVEEVVEPTREFVSLPDTLVPGSIIRVPCLAEIKGEVYDLLVEQNGQLWIGTEYGVIRYDDNGWELTGWEKLTIDSAQTYADLIALRAGKDAAFRQADTATQEAYLEAVRQINDLSGQPLEPGQVVNVYSRPNAYAVQQIAQSGDNLFFATEQGLIQHNDNGWQRAGFKGLGAAQVDDIFTYGDEIWFLSDARLIAKGRGKTEFTLMHANWLPALAPDLFYEYLGFVTSSEGLGTFGGNVTFISYGSIVRTGEGSSDPLGTFDAFELAVTASYGTSLSKTLKGGISAKWVHSHLSEFGAGAEKGNGITSAFALDLGIMYQINPRLNLGVAITNLGPSVQYSDNPQSDALPRNFAAGLAWKMKQSEYINILGIIEANKELVDLSGPRKEEFDEIIWSGGIEFDYMKLIAARIGYYYDKIGQIQTVTLGAGVSPMDLLKFDFAYIPSNKDVSLANTLRLSLTLRP